MPEDKIMLVGLFAILALFVSVSSSEAKLQGLIVEVNTEKVIDSGDAIVVTGSVVDHAYDPIEEAEIIIRIGANTTRIFTNGSGEFSGEFQNMKRAPATYTVNVVASWEGMTGLASTQFQVKGETANVSTLEAKLATDEAKKYLAAKESDFEKDPIGQTLFKYYQGLAEELESEKKKNQPTEEQIKLEQKRRDAKKAKDEAIDFYNPGSGTYGGYQYERYIKSLSPEIKELVTKQLNFTKDMFEKAQKTRDKILADGGTYEEARQAYLDIISIPREILEKFNDDKMSESEEQPEEESNGESKEQPEEESNGESKEQDKSSKKQ